MGQRTASGDFADAHEAKLNGKKVCVKGLRSYVRDTRGVIKRVCLYPHSSLTTITGTPGRQAFYREVVVWRRLQHPNIVPFLGVLTKIPPFKIVCDWMGNDNIIQYAKTNPGVNRVDLVSGLAPIVTISLNAKICS